MKPLLLPVALLVLILGGVAAMWSFNRGPASASPATVESSTAVKHSSRFNGHSRAPDAEPIAPELAALAASLRSGPPRPANRPAAAASSANSAADPDEEDLDPILLARIALSYIGTDPEAEAYWLEMINNPDVSAEDRKDLIEDLNESGFADPDNLKPTDLPLIEARIALIERIAPQPMDQTNADAFKEALKDLKEMQVRLKSEAGPAPPAGSQ